MWVEKTDFLPIKQRETSEVEVVCDRVRQLPHELCSSSSQAFFPTRRRTVRQRRGKERCVRESEGQSMRVNRPTILSTVVEKIKTLVRAFDVTYYCCCCCIIHVYAIHVKVLPEESECVCERERERESMWGTSGALSADFSFHSLQKPF